MSPTRRTFLLAGAGAPFAPALPEPAGPDDFTPLRHRWLDLTLGAGHDPGAEPYATRLRATGTRAEQLRTTMDPAPGRLWPGHPFTDPAAITRSHRRLWTMTQAYVQPGTGRTGAPDLLAATLHGLDHLATVYHPGTRPHGNWWEWRIGTPRLLTDIALALHDHLTPVRHAAIRAAVDHFVPDSALRDYSGTSTGANRVDMCRVVALRGVLGRDGDRIALARDALSPVLPYVTEGDGWYADGSFLQHTRVAYTGTYGQILLDGLARLLVLLDGTPWEITDPNRRTVLDSVERTFAPLLLDGLMMDIVNGRALSRGLQRSEDGTALRGDHSHGHTVIAAIALLATSTHPALTPERRDRWHARIKGWIARDTVTPLLDSPHLGPADLARLRAVAARPLTPAPEPVAHTLFPAMDRAVHRRPAFTAALAMASDRVAHYECGAGENPRGWHTGAGMLQWWPAGRPADQYTDWYWPTVDWYRLPGTTVSTRRLPDRAGGEWGEPRPPTRRVGGTTDGEYAAVGQDLAGLGSTLRARKSWFFLADTVLCLGAGITCADGVPVETVVDNRNLGADGTPRLRTAPGPRPHWAHLEGHGGWLLPGGAPLRTLREDRTGAWSDINAHSASDRRTRRWQTLWLDHGTDPTDASYVYAVLPGASAATLTARAATAHWLSVLANDTARQAVAVHPLGLIAANFWQPATAGGVTADAPASVLVRHHGRTATLHISEPARTGRPLGILWDRPVRRVLSHDPGIDVLTTGHRLRLRVTPGTRCASHRCEVSLA